MTTVIIEWTLVILSDVVHFSFIIAILYTLGRFYRYRYSQALQKRSPILVYLMNICFMLYFLHNITHKIAYIYGEKNWNIHSLLKAEDIGLPFITTLISMICYIFSLHGMTIMWIARSWIIYFNCQYGLEVPKKEWGMHLNLHYSDTLWFVKHRKDYGSNRMIYTIAIIWYIVDALLSAFLLLMSPDIWFIYDPASLLIKFIILVIIWIKMPSFNDIFGIKKEMQWMFTVAGIALLLDIGYVATVSIFGHDLWVFMFVEFIFGIMAGIMALILNGFIFYNRHYNHLISIHLTESRLKALSINPVCDAAAREKLSLTEILENSQLIECMFEHLTDEFSIELLLALIEFKQFHDLMTNDEEFMGGIQPTISTKDTRISENILFKMSLPDELPESSIVHGNHRQDQPNDNHIKRYFEVARDLFYKYVSTTAEFQINLGDQCRQKIAYFIQEHKGLSETDALNESEQLELFTLFNEASNELYLLLRASRNRCIIAKKHYLNTV